MRTPAPGSGWGLSAGPAHDTGSASAAQVLPGLPVAIAIEVDVPLPHQLPGAGVGADFLAVVAAATGPGAIRDHSAGPTTAEIPGDSEDLVEAAARFVDGLALRADESVQLAAPSVADRHRTT
jgi:hypothetical protein